MLKGKSKHIFISYAHLNSKTAKAVEHCLKQAGFQVWWDVNLQTGEKWAQEIDLALLNATIVLVLWSEQSICSEWVKHEASIGKIRNVLTHVIIDDVTVPSIFGSIQHTNLSKWNGTLEEPEFQQLLKGIKQIRWKNKTHYLRQIILISLSTLVLTSVLMFVGYQLNSLFAGPGKETVTAWKAHTDYVEVKLNTQHLRDYYKSGQWDLAFLCREYEGRENPNYINSSFAFIPFDSASSNPTYTIKFHSLMSDNLMLNSSIECDVSVVEKQFNLTWLSPLTETGYQGIKWQKDKLENNIALNELVSIIHQEKFATITTDICKCAAFYQSSDLAP